MAKDQIKRNLVRNTSAEAKLDPASMAVVALFPGGIESQEAHGQRQLVNSDLLPSDGSENPAWAKMGVVFGNKVEGDELFREVTLPPGWRKDGTDHAMWSKLIDDKGRERAKIFYKAAFYDRRAFVRPSSRFVIQQVYEDSGRLDQHEVTDCGKRIFATAQEVTPTDREKRIEAEDRQRAECAAWLTERFPRWEADDHWEDA